MTLKRALILLGAAALTAAMFLCVGCGGTQAKAPASVMANEYDGAPCWVPTEGYCLKKQSGNEKCVFGVGIVEGTRNTSLARDAALGRARTKIAGTLNTLVVGIVKEYAASASGGEEFGQAASDEQYLESVAKQIVTPLNLTGAEMVDSWISNSGKYYVLARLDVAEFKGIVGSMSQLSEKVRAAVTERADKAFADLDKEVAGASGN